MKQTTYSGKRLSRIKAGATAALAALVLSACASSGLSDSRQSGFMTPGEYGRLQQVAGTEPGVTLYRYVSPDFRRSDYKALIVDPVVLFQTALQPEGKEGLTDEGIYKTRALIDSEIKARAARGIRVTSQPGPGVAHVTIAITGAQIDGSSFKPRNVVPVSAVLFAAQKASGLDAKTPSLVVEAKLHDSVSGKLLGEGVFVMSGETFRTQSGTTEAFQKLAADWVTIAVRIASGMTEGN